MQQFWSLLDFPTVYGVQNSVQSELGAYVRRSRHYNCPCARTQAGPALGSWVSFRSSWRGSAHRDILCIFSMTWHMKQTEAVAETCSLVRTIMLSQTLRRPGKGQVGAFCNLRA